MSQLIFYSEWKKNIPNHLKAYIRAKQKMLKDIEKPNQSNIHSLEKTLNNIITNEYFKQNIAPQFSQIIEKKEKTTLSNIQVNEKLKVFTNESAQAWKKYYEEKNKCDKAIQKLTEEQETKLKDLKSEALRLQGQVNKAQGDAFEAFLQIMVSEMGNQGQELVDKQTESFLNKINNNFQSKNYSDITTIGSKHREIIAQFFKDKWVISSQGKVDVSVDAPFSESDSKLQISAKNYNTFRNLHLLDKGNVIGLVSQWPVSNSSKYYFYNALTVWETPEKVLEAGKILFAIQSLSGVSAQSELLANVLIINVRNDNIHPIRVISIPSILDNFFSKNFIKYKGQDPFNFYFSPSLQLFKQGESRTMENFKSRVKELTLDTTLNKVYLYLNYLKKLK